MLRIAVPYGTLSPRQLRMLAHIARKYDKGYGHFTTRQNIQFNWIKLVDVPDMLADLATVEMHAIQTSGNCIRNVTADHFAGAAPTRSKTRASSPRSCGNGRRCIRNSPICRASSRSRFPAPSMIARRCKFHDVGGRDRAATQTGEIGYRVYAGGGMGRTPYIGHVVGDFVREAATSSRSSKR